MKRRQFLELASLATTGLAAQHLWPRRAWGETKPAAAGDGGDYRYRVAFGAWINDMRNDPLPLENWPAPQFDEETIAGLTRAMDVQAKAGFNLLDTWGLFATYGWPPDIVSALTDDRREKIRRVIAEGRQRGIGLVLGLGTYSWGYDKIIAADPEVCGKNQDGTPHAHAMCDANPRSFEYVKKIIDFALGQFDFAGVHLESCDLGCCACPQCAGKDGVVGYNVRINRKTADYIKNKWPDKIVYVITINWKPAGQHFTDAEKAQVIELGRHVDCIFDQGHVGYHVAENERRQFVRDLRCAYGTSGHLWLYPDARWDRESYFLPYARRTNEAIRKQYEDGVRGCLYYQGPVRNPGQEFMIAVGGRSLRDTRRSVDDVVAEVLDEYYRPADAEAGKRLAGIFQTAEESYFGQWSEERFRKISGIPMPGEFKLDNHLFGTSPGPATYLKDPYLDADGRKEYRKGLKSVLEELPKLEGRCQDDGRLARIRRSVIVTLSMLNTVCYCLGEPISS